MDQKLKNAYSLEGILEKKSPSLFKGYQKRHFAIRTEGQFIVYSKKKKIGNDIKPKGVIPIEQLTQISRIKGSDREFVLQIKDRQFLLRAEDSSTRDLWTNTIAFLQEKLLEKLNNPNPQLASKDSFSIRSSEAPKLSNKASWKELDQETKTAILLDKENHDNIKNNEEQEIKNEEIMKSKGLYAYLQKFDPQKFNQFVKCGFLLKKGKMSKISRAKKRWFILISSVSLLGDDAQIQGPTQQDIPDTFKLNYLYYFAYDSRGDQSAYLGKIKASEIEEFELMNVDKHSTLIQTIKQQLSYGFTFKYKDRQYHFFSESLSEIQSWVKAIRAIKQSNQQNDQEESENLEINKEDIITEAVMQVKIHRKIRKDKWFQRKVYLKKNSLIWAAQNKSDEENYILIISIQNIISGKENDFHIQTKDDKIFKFRVNNQEIKNDWINRLQFLLQNIKGEFKDFEKVTELPPEQEKKKQEKKQDNDQSQNTKLTEEQSEEFDRINQQQDMANFYDNYFSSKEQEKKERDEKVGKKQGNIFQKMFCCYQEDAETDRGF